MQANSLWRSSSKVPRVTLPSSGSCNLTREPLASSEDKWTTTHSPEHRKADRWTLYHPPSNTHNHSSHKKEVEEVQLSLQHSYLIPCIIVYISSSSLAWSQICLCCLVNSMQTDLRPNWQFPISQMQQSEKCFLQRIMFSVMKHPILHPQYHW